MWRLAVFAVLILGVAATVAHAQGGGRPQRPFRGIFGGGGTRDPQAPRTTVQLILNGSGTYDEHLAPGSAGGGPSADPSIAPAGSIGEFSTEMRIERVRTGNLFGLDLNGFVSRYGSDPVQVRSGGGLVARAQHAYGRGDRSSISATQRLQYDPVYTGDGISLVRPPTGFEGMVNVDPSGLYFRESFTSDSTVGLSTELSPRDRVNAGYGYTLRDYLDDAGGDSKHHNVTASYDRQLSRSVSVQTNYQWAKADVDLNARFALPLSEHFITVGPQYVKRLSPTRRITVGGGIGGTYVTERNQLTGAETATWAPSGQAHAAIDITRDWSLDGNYARSVTINQGLTRQSLLLDSATISLHGLPHDRVELSSVFGFSVQAGDVGEPIVGNSDYRSQNFSTTGRIALSRIFALELTYAYYDYDFGGADLLEGIPQRFSRNVGTVGLTMWLPLYGRTVGAPRQ